MNDKTLSCFPPPPLAGIIVIGAGLLSLIATNTAAFATTYSNALNYPLAGLNLLQWVNQGLAAIVFLYLALTLKAILFTRHVRPPYSRRLPLLAALLGLLLPAMMYLIFNSFNPPSLHGWRIPMTSDFIVVFALLALLGKRLPIALAHFLLTLLIAENIFALLLTSVLPIPQLSSLYLIFVAIVYLVLIYCNIKGKTQHRIYLLGGALLWWACLQAGVQAAIAGVLLAAVMPLHLPDQITPAPALQWQQGLHHWVAWVIVPIIVLANLGFSFADYSWATLLSPVSFGVALGFIFKPVGIFGTIWLLVKLRWATLPTGVSLWHILGASLLCGVGLSMSVWMSALLLPDVASLNSSKIAILLCSAILAFMAYWVLRLAAVLQRAI